MFVQLGEELAGDLVQVEKRLQSAVASEEPLLSEIAMHVIGAGGKRLRPMAALLAYRACGGRPGDTHALDIAVGLELIHSASLIHDDINDGALLRRGKEAAHRKYGIQNALVTGDFLFTKGFQLAGKFDETVVNWTAEACTKLAEGEILQARHRRDAKVPLEAYFRLISCKTAWVIAQGCRIGAYLAEAPKETQDGIADFGLNLGIAFQIVDDVLDVRGDDAITGKVVGIDVREGNATLPTLLALRRGGPKAERLARILMTHVKSDAEVKEALGLIRELDGDKQAMEHAVEYARKARASLMQVPQNRYRDHLEALVDHVLTRSF